MLTPKNIKARTAIEYFREGYYQKGKWLGQGAVALGLEGEIKDIAAYENIIKGLSPDGTQKLFGRSVDEEKRKAALDCTFAAPKSVSLCALVGGDDRLIKAHQDAVEKVLIWMEQEYAQTRMMLDGKTQEVVKTGNLVIAKYDHIETRELDPHLHSHCLVMNMTQLPNGEWYSHLNDAIFRNQKLLGMMYQHYLALSVQKLGYEIEKRSHGQFDIKGYTPEQLQDFSKRRQQILASAGENSSWLEREKAWKKTRKNKEHIKPEELKAKWQQEAEALGIKIVQPREPSLVAPLSSVIESPEIDPKLVEDAIAHCSQKRVAFLAKDIREFILSHSQQAIDMVAIGPLLDSNTELIRLNYKDGIRYTTQAAVQRELDTIRLMHFRQQAVASITHPEVVEHYLESIKLKQNRELNEGQRQAVMMALTTNDQFIAWQGVAGAGKTFALEQVKALAEAQNYTVKGFAPSAKAARVLAKDIKSGTNTVASLLCSKLPDESQPLQLWIVDEAGLLSAKDAHALLERAIKEKARVILVGDTKQLSAVEAGNPFKSLQQGGIKTAYLTQSQRQKNPNLKIAVDLLASGCIKEGFNKLKDDGRILKVDAASIVDEIVKAYLKLTPQERTQTLLLAGTNEERRTITTALRKELRAEGSLGSDVTLYQLKAKDLSDIEKQRYLSHFESGDVVMPLRDYKRKGLVKGETYTVVGKTVDKLQLKAIDGTQLAVDLDFKKAVFERSQIQIAVGDRLMWKKNQGKERVNGEEVIVRAINGSQVEIQALDGKTSIIDLNKPHHLDHALVRTTYSSQGETADRVLVAADSTIGKESFYVAASRGKNELHFFTQNPEKLLSWALESKAQENPLELLQEQLEKQMQLETVVSPSVVREKPLSVASSSIAHEAQSTVAPPIKRANVPSEIEKAPPVKAPKVPLQLLSKEVPKPLKKTRPVSHTDQDAIAYKANRQLPSPPEWLAVGKRVYSLNQGWGEVEGVERAKLVLKLDTGKPAQILSWPDAINSKSVVPEPVPFWIPSTPEVSPARLEPAHWHELTSGSIIHPEIAARNFRSLGDDMVEKWHEAWNYLFYSDKLKYTNTGRLSPGMIKRYQHIESGGWWCDAGVDPRCFKNLEVGKRPAEKLWGCYKPNNPRENPENGKKIKYEHPLKVDLSIFLLEVPQQIADRIYKLASVEPSESDRASGFWYCVWKHNIPVTITEGAKKAACLLSQGHAAIGLPGIYAGYRSKDEQGNEIKAHLHEELAVFATPEREIKFAFDYETKPKTQRNIEIAISRTGSLMERQGARVSVVTLPGPDKGVDDLIKNAGPLAYERAFFEALRLKVWRDKKKEQQQIPEKSTQELSVEERFERLKVKLANKPRELEQSVKPEVLEETLSTDQSYIANGSTGTRELDILNANQRKEDSYERPDTKQQQTRSFVKSIADYIRQSSVQSNPALIDALKTLKSELVMLQTADQSKAAEQLNTAVSDYKQKLITQGHKPFQPPAPDELNWAAVRQYLIEKRSLPEGLVDELHQQGAIYADSKQNAVFLQSNEQGKVTGANLSGTYKNNQFEGLEAGRRKDEGWFSLSQGQGQLERIVLVESPIEAISAAALSRQKNGMTMFISTDGAGAVPIEMLRQHQAAGVRVIVGYDANPAGEEMVRQLMETLPGADRAKPSYGKNWNEELLYQKNLSPQQMWSRYTKGIEADPNLSVNASRRALRDRRTPDAIKQMLTADPQYQKLLQQLGIESANRYAEIVCKAANLAEMKRGQQPLPPSQQQKRQPQR